MKYSPRSCTQFAQSARLILFGELNTGCAGSTSFISAFSSVTRSRPTFAGNGPYCASLNSNLLYWTTIVPPLNT